MSRSAPTLTNPAHRFYEWKGGAGSLEYYDKEKQERVSVPLPFTFMPLDQLATITGFSKMAGGSYYSNEVRNSAKEPFTVKLKGQTVYTGMYKNEQGIAQMPKGAGYAKSIYFAYKDNGQYVIGNFKASGSALGAWIELTNSCNPENGKITITKGDKQTSPVGDFYAPVFTYSACTDEEDHEAVRLDKELQTYLNHYFVASTDDIAPDAEDDGKATPEQIADFNRRKAAKGMQPLDADDFPDDQETYNNIASDEPPFTDDDLPPEFRG